MSLLRDVLKRSKPSSNGPDGAKLPLSSKRNIKSYASSIKSSGGASMRSLAESMFSFYSAVTGSGPRVPKRRRPDYSKLGVPEWYAEDPPPLVAMPGTGPPSKFPPFITAHSTVMHATDAGVEPWLAVVLHSHAPTSSSSVMPMYHNAAKITGEVRMVLANPTSLSSIDVWFVLRSDSVVDFQKLPILSMTANLWNRKKGNPRAMADGSGPFKGKFPAGTYIFPFQFAALPEDTIVKHPNEERRQNQGRVPLPPTYHLGMVGSFSGNIKHTIGVNVTREGIGSVDEEFDVDVQYLPLAKPLPRVKTPFPYLPTREDWPFAREVVGGWTLTPFGGRGRLGEEIAELEGILGIQEPAVRTGGQTLEFSLILWSANPLALEALAQPGAIEVGYYKTDIFSLDALNPKNTSRKNRKLERLAEGRVWSTDAGRPADDAPRPECTLVKVPESSPGSKPPNSSGSGVGSSRIKVASSSRMQQVWTADTVDASHDTLVGDVSTLAIKTGDPAEPEDENAERAPSPTPSLEGLDDLPDPERVVRLDGEIRVPACSHPSFRFTNMAREYILRLTITHPQYSHISPSGMGIIAEVPVWYVLDRFEHRAPGAAQQKADYSALPVKGSVLPVGDDAIRLPSSVGQVTTQKRPTFRAERVAAF